jgi:ankyrin repeat protein
LYAASDNGHVEIVRLLVENGADVNAVGNFGSALQAASLWAKWANDSLEDYREIVEILLENGAHGENATSFGSSQTEIFEVEWI